MGYEFELKYRATPQVQEALRCAFPAGRVILMETTYYDTADGSLSAQKMTLRCRRENESFVCTLKTPAGKLGRGEFDVQCAQIAEALPQLSQLSGVTLPQEGIFPVCGGKFTRYAREIVGENCTVELALDAGVLTGGGKEEPLCEVEIELKSGSREDAVAIAQQLACQYGLQPEEKSKFCRALALAKGEI